MKMAIEINDKYGDLFTKCKNNEEDIFTIFKEMNSDGFSNNRITKYMEAYVTGNYRVKNVVEEGDWVYYLVNPPQENVLRWDYVNTIRGNRCELLLSESIVSLENVSKVPESDIKHLLWQKLNEIMSETSLEQMEDVLFYTINLINMSDYDELD